MPFKDNISKIAKSLGDNAVNVANNVAKKSGELVEVSKLNIKISAQEDRIKEVYSVIGKLVYDKYLTGDTFNDEIMEKCREISQCNEAIEDIRHKINELKSTKVCPSCGTKMKQDSLFCPKCGTRQE